MLRLCERDSALRAVVRRGHDTGNCADADVTHRAAAAVSCSAAAAAAVNGTHDERLDRRRRSTAKTRRLRSVKAQLTS